MYPQSPHPAIRQPPLCLACGSETTRRITSPRNPNGNGGRPYYKCVPCGQFSCFADLRGVHAAANPACDCGHSSRLQLAASGSAKRPGALHYRCAVGGCGFFAWCWNSSSSSKGGGGPVRLPLRVYAPEEMVRAGL